MSKKSSFNEHAFDIITEESAYWIGFLMADGGVNKNGYSVYLNLSSKDIGHIEKFKKFMKSPNPIKNIIIKDPFKNGKDYNTSSFTVTSLYLKNKISEYGIKPKKSATAKVSDNLAYNRHFWRGVIDGDGTVTLEKKKALNSVHTEYYWYTYINLIGSYCLVNQFNDYIGNLIKKDYKKSIKNHKTYYLLHIGGKNAFYIMKDLYENSNIFLDRKKKIIEDIILKVVNGEIFRGARKKITNKDSEMIYEIFKEERKNGKFVEKIVQELATKFGVSTRLVHDVVYRGYRVKKDE